MSLWYCVIGLGIYSMMVQTGNWDKNKPLGVFIAGVFFWPAVLIFESIDAIEKWSKS